MFIQNSGYYLFFLKIYLLRSDYVNYADLEKIHKSLTAAKPLVVCRFLPIFFCLFVYFKIS
jgi:hypothetical protein